MSQTSKLNEDTRLCILRIIACHLNAMSAREIADKLDMSHRSTSEYLLKLWHYGTLTRERAGREWRYAITAGAREELKDAIDPRPVSALAAAAV